MLHRYQIDWQRTHDNIDLDGVEFKSLPSGLHAVSSDLVYFIHGLHAGISVFVQEEADATSRNANFAAVGALVPLKYGQLGRSWLHADELRGLARQVVSNTKDTRALELFWKTHGQNGRKASVSPSASRRRASGDASHKRKRASSETTIAGLNSTEGAWPLDHPALHVPKMLETLGPLLFPIHRAALSRQRVLFLGSPSVKQNVDTVYLTSVLANIPKSLEENLPSEQAFRPSPLFSVGIHDIPSLSSHEHRNGWIATTTDDILGEKKNLFDLLVQLPSKSAPSKWPILKTSDGKIVKASQRDFRRWTLLRRELRRLRRQTVARFAQDSPTGENNDQRPLLERRNTGAQDFYDMGLQNRDESDAVEPSTWSALAYRGFMWWASAGDVSAWENEEAKADEELLFDMPDVGGLFLGTEGERVQEEKESEYSRAAATLLVAYFRRITEGILQPMANLVEQADDATEEGISGEELLFSADDLRPMGLDAWSERDKLFVRRMMKLYFDREADIADGGVQVCGVRIC